MSRSLKLCIALAMLAAPACTRVKVAEIPLDNTVFGEAKRIDEPKPQTEFVPTPEPLPLPGQLKPAPEPDGDAEPQPSEEAPAPEVDVEDANRAAKIEPAKDGYINAIQVYPFTPGALYQLYAAPMQVCDIALEAGETLIAVSAGDTARWIIGDTTSGEGAAARVHILVKPSAKGLTTNLVITTNRRTYHIEAHSTDATYMASLSWTYPETELIRRKQQAASAAIAAEAVAQTGVNLERLQFRYRIEGNAPWRPAQVFDDGEKVYIRFPAGLARGESPPLFVLGETGQPALVNYRVQGATYIVDRLFAAAELRLGEAPQRVVRIIRTDAAWREMWK
ncbi:MAG: P-type conjugative transfer protein TrbG [Hyphomicrobiales bacterium]|nr:P-type conjugative transfer protein TrbG [Hyphomicrobiales bacterium]